MADTIESIEKSYWGPPPAAATVLVRKCHELRQKDVELLDIEDLRLLIGQGIALKIVVPMALKVLEKDMLAEGDMYPGDLLKAVLESDEKYWRQHPEAKQAVLDLYRTREDLVRASLQGRILEAAFFIFRR